MPPLPLPPLVPPQPAQPRAEAHPEVAVLPPRLRVPHPPAHQAVPREPAFPAPMAYSFGTPRSAARPPVSPSVRRRGAIDFSLGPAARGATDDSPFARVAGAHAGADWRNALSDWVRRHAYYPEQAIAHGEDGSVTVQVVAGPDGRVRSVELDEKSGSIWLDMALLSMFRDAHLPPLPPDEREPITFRFTMHYVLLR
ncbi:MAG TPA: TonB family protein [Acetobacteraceae bacterium]